MIDTNYAVRDRERFLKRQAQREIHKEIVNSDINRRVCGCIDDGFLRTMTVAGFRKKARKRK